MAATGIREGMADIARQGLLQTQEAMLETKNKKNSLHIGIPKEISFQENRIALTPLSVALLVNNGHNVILESGAGTAANFSDREYAEQGAKITYDKKEVFNSDILVKIAPPMLSEIAMMHKGQTLISSLQTGTLKQDYLKALMHKKINALCFEHLRDEGNVLSVVRDERNCRLYLNINCRRILK